MIAAETLTAPRSPDAPAVAQSAGRPTEGAAFAQVLAQRMDAEPTAPAQPVAAEPGTTAPMADAILASATQVAGLTLTTGTAATGAGQTSVSDAHAVPAANGSAAADAAPAGDLAQTAPPGTATTTAEPAVDGITPDAPPAPLAEPDAATPPTTAEATPQAEDTAEVADQDAAQDAAQDTASQPQATPLPPLVALIQPLLAPQTGADGDTSDTPGQTEITGSTPRQRGMSGRLAMLTDSQPPAQNTDGFSDRLAAVTDKAPDAQPTQGNTMADLMTPETPIDTQTDTTPADVDGLPATAQPSDTRAATPPGTTPPGTAAQRMPDAAPLDTTRSGWESALTERITARATDLGQEIEITLNPENLGHIRIKLDLSDKAATVQIVTDTPQAAQLFQQSEARLADALNRAGLSLTSHDASARDGGARDGGARDGGQGGRQGQGPGNPRADAALAGLRGTLSAPMVSGRAANLVNIVA